MRRKFQRIKRGKSLRGLTKPRKRALKRIPTRTSLRKKADKIFSQYIRQKYADAEGNVKCYTCPYVNHWKKLQNGHLVSRYYTATRYDERNCRPQCYTCNMWRNGMTPHFAANLQAELGDGIVEELYKLARTITPEFDYERIIEHYSRPMIHE